jgi:alkylation response protein AidB-like acyl-CoA dehydrogenase
MSQRASHFRSNLRDLEFNLFEFLDPDHVGFGSGPFAEVDAETARSVLAEVDRLAREELAASYVAADRNPPVFDPAAGTVSLPAELHRSFEAFMSAEYWRLTLPPELGGTPAPRTFWWSLAELVLGANAPVWMYASGPSFATTLVREGTPEQHDWARLFIEKGWGATMVLTEPDAGSDVGAARTRAIPQPDGSWHIDGVKRFITSGEHDLTENIIHYVLARPDGAGSGTKGLSMFVVPKFHFDPATGELGERNGVVASNVEHKMGLNASATCEMSFGQHGTPAVGWLLGEVHDGIRQMFLIIEAARMMVGTKAIATLSTGYLNALEYARNRVQGADLMSTGDRTAPKVTIIRHPDVRRSLMLQKSYAEGLRALVAYTGSWQDRARLAAAAGDAAAATHAGRINDLLLPIVKGAGSERAYELLGAESLQTLGGSGYLRDYPLEQYVRDAKIDTLYEGTTAIQSLDLFFRKIVKDGGVAVRAVAGEIRSFVESEGGNGRLKEERVALGRALSDVRAMLDTLTGFAGQGKVYEIGLSSRRLLLALGDLLVGWLLQRQAEVALAALTSDGVSDADRDFYQGKVAAARFFAREILPRLAADRAVIAATTAELMEVPEPAF